MLVQSYERGFYYLQWFSILSEYENFLPDDWLRAMPLSLGAYPYLRSVLASIYNFSKQPRQTFLPLLDRVSATMYHIPASGGYMISLENLLLLFGGSVARVGAEVNPMAVGLESIVPRVKTVQGLVDSMGPGVLQSAVISQLSSHGSGLRACVESELVRYLTAPSSQKRKRISVGFYASTLLKSKISAAHPDYFLKIFQLVILRPQVVILRLQVVILQRLQKTSMTP